MEKTAIVLVLDKLDTVLSQCIHWRALGFHFLPVNEEGLLSPTFQNFCKEIAPLK